MVKGLEGWFPNMAKMAKLAKGGEGGGHLGPGVGRWQCGRVRLKPYPRHRAARLHEALAGIRLQARHQWRVIANLARALAWPR